MATPRMKRLPCAAFSVASRSGEKRERAAEGDRVARDRHQLLISSREN